MISCVFPGGLAVARQMDIGTAAGLTRRLATGHNAGADLLMLLGAEVKSGSIRHREAIEALIDGVKQGVPLSKSMQQYGDYFPPLLVGMTRVGETTGRFERTMYLLADHYDHRVSVRRAFWISIAWPLLQLVAGILVIALLILILGLLKPGGQEMMDITGFGLRGPSGALIFLLLVGLCFAALAGVVVGLRRNVLGCHNLIPLFYMLPKLGPAIRTITLARFTWVLALTLDTGLDAIRAVTLALDSTGSDYYRGGIRPATAAIEQGQSLTESLRATEVLPDDFLVQMEVAELSGTDAESLQALALEYEQQAKLAVKTLSGILSVLIWLVIIVVFVGMIINMLMRVYQPYYDALQPI